MYHQKTLNKYSYYIYKEDVSKTYDKSAIDVHSTVNNNAISDVDSFVVNGNLALGQIAVHKTFRSNQPVDVMQYILPHQVQCISINNLA